MKICFIGTGFVGVVSAAVFASFGNQVVGLDIDEKKIEKLKEGIVPFFEPGLQELLLEQQKTGNLTFVTDYETAIKDADVVIIIVGTPSKESGEADLTYVFKAAESLAPHLKPNAIVVVKSTVPPGSFKTVEGKIRSNTQVPFTMASLPEFLKEGTAVQDTLHPDRVVIGADDDATFAKLEEMHKPFNVPVVHVSVESAQLGKYASNAYLANRITFINQVADLASKTNADIQEIIQVMGYDKRIGSHYWYPGFGYGGSCFPKDVKELAALSRSLNLDENLFIKMDQLNDERIAKLLTEYGKQIGGWENKKVAVLGLAFKPQTDDMREAPSTKVIPFLISQHAQVIGYDPKAVPVVEHFISPDPQINYTENLESAVTDADVIIALIEWPEIIGFDFSKTKTQTKTQWFIDARNQFEPATVTGWGYQYLGVGRS